MLLEVCVEDVAGLSAATAGGADRIELCSALAVGGLTPSVGLMAAAATGPLPAYAMIRPRAGDFVYSASEVAVMKADIDAARAAGLAGVVLGASRRDGRLDAETLAGLVERAGSLGKTLHRAFDLVPDLREAIEIAVSLGFERILTSGGRRTAPEGADHIEDAIRIAAGRISIMPGSGINPATIDSLLPRLAVIEVHASCSVADAPAEARIRTLGFAAEGARHTDAAAVRRLKACLA